MVAPVSRAAGRTCGIGRLGRHALAVSWPEARPSGVVRELA